MFEQELYRQDFGVPEGEPGDLFYKYEIKSWVLSNRIYSIVAVSALLNLAFLAFVVQTNLLTLRGCDSPFVGRVCQVLDMAYVGSILLGSDRAYVDEAYEKIDLADSDITFISRDGDNAPLEYPAGYFQIANPEQNYNLGSATPNPFDAGPIPGIPSALAPSNSLFDTPQQLPKANPNPIAGPIPTSPFSTDGSGAGVPVARSRKGRRAGRVPDATNAMANDNATAQSTPEPAPSPLSSEAVTGLQINKKPLTDLADRVASDWSANTVDLNAKFTVSLSGVLTKDGKLDPKKSLWDKTKETGDQRIIEVARQSLEAVGESGFLQYLVALGVDKIRIDLVQDDKQITAVITSNQKSPEVARTLQSGLNGYISLAKATIKNPSDELTLLNGANVAADGNNFVVNFAIPKAVAQEMISRKLREAQAKKAQQPGAGSPSPAGVAPAGR